MAQPLASPYWIRQVKSNKKRNPDFWTIEVFELLSLERMIKQLEPTSKQGGLMTIWVPFCVTIIFIGHQLGYPALPKQITWVKCSSWNNLIWTWLNWISYTILNPQKNAESNVKPSLDCCISTWIMWFIKYTI